MSALKTTTTRTLRHILPSLSLRPLLTPRLLPLIHSNPYATTTTSLLHSLPSPPPPKPLPSIPVSPPTSDATPVKTAIGKIERRLQITFTCTAHLDPTDENAEGVEQECRHRSTHEFSRTSYEKGIVLIQCPGCGNRHLIADNLSWFSSTPSTAHPDGLPIGTAKPETRRTVEDLVKENGEKVKWLESENGKGGTWTLE